MEEDRVNAIRTPLWYRGLHPNHRRGAMDYTLLAFDTETVRGYPYTLQTTDGEIPRLQYLRPRQFLPRLVRSMDEHLRGGHRAVVMAGFNLAYDLPAILYPNHRRFAEQTFTIRCMDTDLDVYYGRIPFAKLRTGKKVVWVIDLYAFVWCSLAKAAAMFNLPVQKQKKPAYLGRRVLRGREFERYALGDVQATWFLGQEILKLHKEFDVRLCVSIAQFAGRVFLHHFLKRAIPRAPVDVQRAALLSYHGGKNGFYLPGPCWVQCREYDLKSAYPWAMTQMPSLSAGKWRMVDSIHPTLEGFYCVTGEVAQDRYPILYTHDFKPIQGRVDQVWITSYEMREAIRSGELFIESVSGFVWEPSSKDQPLRAFVEEFYRRKQTATLPQEREVYKLILNSLYGKFIQLNPEPDGTERPGALFHPVLASWITGLVRARMHQLEHDAGAIHTATDAIHTTRTMPTGTNLGDLEEVQRGPALLIRNKVYLHFDEDGISLKYAMHGIHLTARRFWERLCRGQRRYRITHILRPREAVRKGKPPLLPVVQSYTMHFGTVPMENVPTVARRFFEGGKRNADKVAMVDRRGGGRMDRAASVVPDVSGKTAPMVR